MLDVGLSTIYAWIAKGRIPNYRIGGSIRIDKKVLPQLRKDLMEEKLKHEI